MELASLRYTCSVRELGVVYSGSPLPPTTKSRYHGAIISFITSKRVKTYLSKHGFKCVGRYVSSDGRSTVYVMLRINRPVRKVKKARR